MENEKKKRKEKVFQHIIIQSDDHLIHITIAMREDDDFPTWQKNAIINILILLLLLLLLLNN